MADTHVGCVKRTAFLVLACCLALGFAHGQEGLPVPRGPAGVAVVAKDAKSGQLQPVSLYGKMLALVVGIDDYADSTLNLEYSVRDAKAVAEALRNQFEFSTVLELYNAKATQEAIVGAVMQLVKQAEYNDAVLVFFAGHGTQVGRGENAVGYLIPHDGGPQEEKREWARNISMTTIVDWSRLIRAKHIFYVMDACYSGLMASRAIGETKLPARDLAYLQEMTKEPVRIVLTAGMAGQKVLDGGPKGHSVFTGRFLEALEREKDFMTAMEVAVELKRKVASDALSRGHTQTPDYARLYGLGDFVFVPKQESLEALQTKLQGVQKLIAEIEGRPGSVKAAELERQKAELEARRLAAAKREEVRKQAEAEAAREAEAKAQRQREAQEMRRKLSEEQAKIAVAQAKNLTIASALGEAKNIFDRLALTQKEVDEEYASRVAKLNAPRDAFEKSTEYQARVAQHKRLTQEVIPAEKQRRVQGFLDALAILDGKEYLVDRSEVEIALDPKAYDADQEVFEVQVKHGKKSAEKFRLHVPPEEARKLYQTWQEQALLPRVYARLKIEKSEQALDAATPLHALHLSVPGQDKPYIALGEEVEKAFRDALAEGEKALGAGEFAAATAAADKALALQPRHAQAASLKTRIQEREQAYRDALAEAKGALDRKDYKGAMASAQKALGLKPNDPEATQVARTAQAKLEGYTAWPFDAQEARRRQKEAADILGAPVETDVDLGGGVSMAFVLIPPGEFVLGGKSGPRVRLTKPFYLAKHEITQAQWQKVMGSQPWSRQQYVKENPQHPAVYISWEDCQESVKKLNSGAGGRFRLPTAAEWEYACRAGTATEYCFGDSPSELKDYAWYEDNAENAGQDYAHEVGKKKPNAWGLHDMHGNVWEWCQDWHGDYGSGVLTDPTGPDRGSGRVLRGGSFGDSAGLCRSGDRFSNSPGYRHDILGARLVRSLP